MRATDHYREAERLLAVADGAAPSSVDERRDALAAAQVHATLAVAAERACVPDVPKVDARALGERLAAFRAAMGWSQERLAETMSEAGFRWHQATVYKTEVGARVVRLDEGIALARLFGVDVETLACPTEE